MIALGDRPRATGGRRIVKTVAHRGEGLADVVEALDKHLAWLGESGELERRRTRRVRDEIETIAVTALRRRWDDVHARVELDDLAAAVVEGESDPYTAADRCWRASSVTEGWPVEVTISAHRGVPAWESPVNLPKVARVAGRRGAAHARGRGLCFDVDGRRVLDDVSLNGAPGRMLAVTGTSGSARPPCCRFSAGWPARPPVRSRTTAGRSPPSRASRCPGTGFVLQSYGLVRP